MQLLREAPKRPGSRCSLSFPKTGCWQRLCSATLPDQLSATVEHLRDGGLQPLDRPLIATISADPGQGYFAGYDAKAVIVRSDKPDLQLAALNAGAACLILTGGLPFSLMCSTVPRRTRYRLCGPPWIRSLQLTASRASLARCRFAGGDAKIKAHHRTPCRDSIWSLCSR